MTTSCSISVAARVRPTTIKPAQIRVDRYLKKIHLRAGESDELLEYEFDQVFDQESSQEQVFAFVIDENVTMELCISLECCALNSPMLISLDRCMRNVSSPFLKQ